MRHWKCQLCESKELLMIMTEHKILMECGACKDTQWVRR